MKKKLTCLITALILAFSLVGCADLLIPGGGDEGLDPNKTYLNVAYFNGGVVADWLLELEKEYEALHTDVDVVIDTSLKDELKNQKLHATIAYRTEDIFFTHTLSYRNFVASKYIADISDVVNAPAAEGEKTVLERMNPELVPGYTYDDGKFYAVPFYNNFSGAVYDVDLFEEKQLYIAEGGGYTGGLTEQGQKRKSLGKDGKEGTYDDGLPVTYEEYKALLSYMKYDKGVTPFIWCNDDSYRMGYYYSLWAGYEGKNNFNLNSTGLGEDTHLGAIDDSNVNKLLEQTGRKFGYDVAHEIISNKYYDSESMNGVILHTAAQEKFLRSRPDNKPIAMILEGCWWERESALVFDSLARRDAKYAYGKRRFAFMTVPKYDENASARETYYATGSDTTAIINANTKNLELAKDFLKFTLSEHAMSVFTKHTGMIRPYDYKLEEGVYDSLTPFQRQFYDIYNDDNVDIAYRQGRRTGFLYDNSTTYFTYDKWNYGSKVGNTTFNDPFIAFMNNPGITAEQYFEGAKALFSDYDERYQNWLGQKA